MGWGGFQIILTHSAAPSPAFEGGVKKRRSGSTLSKPQHLCWGAEGLTSGIIRGEQGLEKNTRGYKNQGCAEEAGKYFASLFILESLFVFHGSCLLILSP